MLEDATVASPDMLKAVTDVPPSVLVDVTGASPDMLKGVTDGLPGVLECVTDAGWGVQQLEHSVKENHTG